MAGGRIIPKKICAINLRFLEVRQANLETLADQNHIMS
jgi:hypothetical protein